jgi:hypothetical protein
MFWCRCRRECIRLKREIKGHSLCVFLIRLYQAMDHCCAPDDTLLDVTAMRRIYVSSLARQRVTFHVLRLIAEETRLGYTASDEGSGVGARHLDDLRPLLPSGLRRGQQTRGSASEWDVSKGLTICAKISPPRIDRREQRECRQASSMN